MEEHGGRGERPHKLQRFTIDTSKPSRLGFEQGTVPLNKYMWFAVTLFSLVFVSLEFVCKENYLGIL